MVRARLHGHRQPVLQEHRWGQRHAARLASGLGEQKHHPIARSLTTCEAARMA